MGTKSKVNASQVILNHIEPHLHVANAVLEHPVPKYSQHMMPMKIFREKNGTGTSPCFINTKASSSAPMYRGDSIIL